MDELEDEGLERGDEPARYPPLGSFQWRERMQRATRELHQAQGQIAGHCAAIHEGVERMFRECEE